MAASGVGVVGQIVGNAIIGGASSVLDYAINDNGQSSFDKYALRAFEGAALGAIAGAIGGPGTASKHTSNSFWRMVASGKDDLTYYFSQVGVQAKRDGIRAIPGILKATTPAVFKGFIQLGNRLQW